MLQAEIDLVAVAYNAPEETAGFLESLVFVDAPFSLTIVENASPIPLPVLEEQAEWVRALPNCVSYEVKHQPLNLGYARACNYGAAFGVAQYLALLNCDVRFRPTTVSRIMEHFRANKTVGIIGPKTVTSDGKLSHAGIVYGPAGNDMHRAWMQPDGPGQYADVLDVRTVAGATYFVRREAWEQLSACSRYLEIAPDAQGAFLPTKHYYEETWCSYHASAHGWGIHYLGTCRMVHEWHKSSPVGTQPIAEAESYFRAAAAHHGIALTW